VKAVILAGGSGTRLYPTTIPINKHLLPIYNKPMIYYPLSLAMLIGIREVALVVNPQDLESFKRLLGEGKQLGMKIDYIIQEKPNGLAEGLVLAEKFLNGEPVCYMLGDNILYGHDIVKVLLEAKEDVERNGGAYVFGYYVKDPERFGVVEFNEKGQVTNIEEKPKRPKSNYAVIGLYFFENEAVDIAKQN
jgi:glucose-1-phosphate thymidylyltransferase